METSQGIKKVCRRSKNLQKENVCNKNKTGSFKFLGFYATLICSQLQEFRNNLSVRCYPETSGLYYRSVLRNIPERRISHFHRSGCLQSRKTSGLSRKVKLTSKLMLQVLEINWRRVILKLHDCVQLPSGLFARTSD